LASQHVLVPEEEVVGGDHEAFAGVLHVDFAECLLGEFQVLVLRQGLDHDPVVEAHSQLVALDAQVQNVVLAVYAHDLVLR